MADRQTVSTAAAPAAIGPYSQAVVYRGLVYASGQLGLDPATGQLRGDTAKDQAAQALDNLDQVLKAGGASLGSMLKVNIYLTDMADFSAVNGVYAARLNPPFPARACVAVASLPKGALVEIEAVAARDQ